MVDNLGMGQGAARPNVVHQVLNVDGANLLASIASQEALNVVIKVDNECNERQVERAEQAQIVLIVASFHERPLLPTIRRQKSTILGNEIEELVISFRVATIVEFFVAHFIRWILGANDYRADILWQRLGEFRSQRGIDLVIMT